MLQYLPKHSILNTNGRLALTALYDELWGIHDHSKDDYNPFSTVGLHPAESLYGDNTIFEKRLLIYIEKGIQKYTGLTFEEFLDYPRHYQEILIRVCGKHKKKDNSSMESISKQFEELSDIP